MTYIRFTRQLHGGRTIVWPEGHFDSPLHGGLRVSVSCTEDHFYRRISWRLSLYGRPFYWESLSRVTIARDHCTGDHLHGGPFSRRTIGTHLARGPVRTGDHPHGGLCTGDNLARETILHAAPGDKQPDLINPRRPACLPHNIFLKAHRRCTQKIICLPHRQSIPLR